MSKWLVGLFVLLCGISVSLFGGASANETISLKEAVKRAIDKVPESGSSEDPAAVPATASAPADTQDVASGVLDEILLSPEPYYYESLGRRDPFVSMVPTEEDADSEYLDRESIAVVGILWGDRDKFALVETADGKSAILREGDTFRNATVTSIQKDGVVLFVNYYGIGRTLRLPLNEGKATENARRRDR
jgi:hypothetical protein